MISSLSLALLYHVCTELLFGHAPLFSFTTMPLLKGKMVSKHTPVMSGKMWGMIEANLHKP
jgi:hypothetical protein